MQNTNISIFTLLLLWFLYLAPQASFAQNKNDFEKQLKEANLSVYQDPEKAVELSTYIYKNAKDIDSQITALVIMVNGFTALNQNGEALKYATKTLELAETSDNIQYQIWAHGLLGEQYQLSHLNSISREYLDKAEILIQNSNLSGEVIAVSLGNIFAIKGNGYKDEIDCDYAIQNYDLAINSYKPYSDNSVAKNNLALVYLEKGNCLLVLNNLNLAKENFQQSLKITQQNKLEEYIQKATLGFAKIGAQNSEYEISKNRAQELLKSIDTLLHPKLKNELYLLLRDNHLALGNIDAYRLYAQKYESSFREIIEIESSQFQQVFRFMESQTDVQKTNFGWQNFLLYGLFGIAIVFIFLLIFKVIK